MFETDQPAPFFLETPLRPPTPPPNEARVFELGEQIALLSARISADHFFFLDAPVQRVAAPDTPIPYSPPLEHDFLPKAATVVAAIHALIDLYSSSDYRLPG